MAGIDSYTKIILHCNGIDESTTFTDNSFAPHSVTAIDNAQIDTSEQKFGTASGKFDGSGDYLSIVDSDDWYFGSNNFTIDFWVQFNSIPSNDYAIVMAQKATGWNDRLNLFFENRGSQNNTGFNFLVLTGGGNVVHLREATGSASDYSTGVWYHIAIVRNGTLWKLYINGIEGASDTNSNTYPNYSAPFLIGGEPTENKYFNGWLDEIRISKGIARWTSNFTPPIEEYSTDIQEDIEEEIQLSDSWAIYVNPETENLLETIYLEDIWDVHTNQVQVEFSESLTLLDEWLIRINPEQQSINETVNIEDSWTINTVEYTHYASQIISYNPLIYVTNTNPAKIVHIDITDPENPIKTVYTLTGAKNAKGLVLNDTNDYFYVICNEGKVVKVDKNDLNDQTIINTGETDTFQFVTCLENYFRTFVSTDDASGELVMIDEAEIKSINTDIRCIAQIIKTIATRIDTILGKIILTDLRCIGQNSKSINTDLRCIAYAYDEINRHPINRTSDWILTINAVDMVPLNDVQMNSIKIAHDVTLSENKASTASFILNRRHDKPNYDNQGTGSQITNNNEVKIYIKNVLEFTGKISTIQANSDNESITIIAIGVRPADKRQTISIPMASVNENLHLYHCLVNDVVVENPYIDPTDETPQYYKGIQVDLGTQIEQQIVRLTNIQNSTTLAEEIEAGDFITKSNWTYFWFAKFTHLILGLTQGTLRYLGTSLGSMSNDAWKLDGCSYRYQKISDDVETELGIYQLGSAPYFEISPKNGKKITKYQYKDEKDGLYLVKEEGYDYEQYAKDVASLEYEKIQTINGVVLPNTSATIELSLDAYYYYGIKPLTRINVTNTTTSNVWNNNNGWPVAVKTINIDSENMRVSLSCDNQKSQIELDEIDARYPDDESDEYLFPETSTKQYSKFNPDSWGYVT